MLRVWRKNRDQSGDKARSLHKDYTIGAV